MRNEIFGLTAGALISVLGPGLAHACDTEPCDDLQRVSACDVGVDCLQPARECPRDEPRCDVRLPTRACDAPDCGRKAPSCPPGADCMPPYWPSPPAVAQRCDGGPGCDRQQPASLVSMTRVGACDPVTGEGCNRHALAT
jgi:hypothetical protein